MSAQKDEPATSTIVLRVTPSRKAAYVRAAHPQTLAAWMIEQCDKAVKLKEEQAKHAGEFTAHVKRMCAYLDQQDIYSQPCHETVTWTRPDCGGVVKRLRQDFQSDDDVRAGAAKWHRQDCPANYRRGGRNAKP